MKIYRQSDYLINEWTGGITRQLYIHPEEASLSARNFTLRISSAVIDLTESDFSDFTGFTRYIMPLEGDIQLMRNGERIVLEKDRLFRFDGSEKISSINSKGATDFNIIHRKDIEISTKIVEGDAETDAGHTTIVFALGDCGIDSIILHRHETLVTEKKTHVTGKAVFITLP